jgi:hypothetical protein
MIAAGPPEARETKERSDHLVELRADEPYVAMQWRSAGVTSDLCRGIS